jgi:hypothetical protein
MYPLYPQWVGDTPGGYTVCTLYTHSWGVYLAIFSTLGIICHGYIYPFRYLVCSLVRPLDLRLVLRRMMHTDGDMIGPLVGCEQVLLESRRERALGAGNRGGRA